MLSVVLLVAAEWLVRKTDFCTSQLTDWLGRSSPEWGCHVYLAIHVPIHWITLADQLLSMLSCQEADLDKAMLYLAENNKKLSDVVCSSTPAQVSQLICSLTPAQVSQLVCSSTPAQVSQLAPATGHQLWTVQLQLKTFSISELVNHSALWLSVALHVGKLYILTVYLWRNFNQK